MEGTAKRDTTGEGIDLSVVVPAEDQGRCTAATLENVNSALRGFSLATREILVVLDGDHLETERAAASFARSNPGTFLLRNPRPLGYGYSARHGVLLSRGERILLLSPFFILQEKLLEEMGRILAEGNDLVVASAGSNGTRPLPAVKIRKELVSRSVQATVRLLSRQRALRQPHFLHLYRRRAALEIYRRQRLDDASFTLEVLYLARRFCYSVMEVAARESGMNGPSAGGWSEHDIGLGQLVRIRMHRLRGDYG